MGATVSWIIRALPYRVMVVEPHARLKRAESGQHRESTFAGVMELVDVPDSKSGA
jgi:hypothetical protein